MSSAAEGDLTREQAETLVRSRGFQKLLVVAAAIGVLVSLLAWCFLELVHWTNEEAFVDLPHALGYSDGAPTWWPLPVLAIAGLIVAAAIVKPPRSRRPRSGARLGRERSDEPGGTAGHRACRTGVARTRCRARSGGTADRHRGRLRRLDPAARPPRCPGPAATVIAADGQLRRDLLHLRIARHRGGDPNRSHRAGRPSLADHPAPRPAWSRNRIPGLPGHGLADRPQRQRLRTRGPGPSHRSTTRTSRTSRGRSCWPSSPRPRATDPPRVGREVEPTSPRGGSSPCRSPDC